MFNRLKLFSELVMMQHTVFSLPFIFIAMLVASSGWFGFDLLLLGILATLFARNYAMAFNRFADKAFDILNVRTSHRPSVDGRLSSASIIIFIIINAICFIVTAFFINKLAFYLSFVFLVILTFYSYIKRFSYLAHLFLGFCLSLAPVAGVIAVSEYLSLWSVFLSLGVLTWVAGFDLLYALQDEDFDKKHHLQSIPARFGKERTLYISSTLHLLTCIFWFLFIQTASLGFIAQIGLLLVCLMLIYEQFLVYKSLENINKAFFTINGYLGFIFLIFIILEFIFLEFNL